MKELNTFRKFLAEGEAKGFIFWFREGEEEQLKKAKEILDREGISFTSRGAMALGFPASADEKNIKSILWKNGVSQYVIANNMEEGQINENTVEQTRDIIVQRLQDELGHDEELDAMYQGYIPLVQQAKDMKKLAMLIDKFGSEVYKVTGDGQWEEYIVKGTPLVDRKTLTSDPMAKIMKEPLGAPSGNPYAEEPTMSDEEFEAIFGKGPQSDDDDDLSDWLSVNVNFEG